MEITWYGLSCFRITERRMAAVVTDPYDASVGLVMPKVRADIVTISEDKVGHNHVKGVRGERRTLRGPGEYEIGGVFVTGIRMAASSKNGKKPSFSSNTLFVFDYEGLTVAHLGNLSYVPTQAQIEDLGTVDVALVPVGGGGTLSSAKSAEVISLIEPSIVIPMHYKTGKEKPKLSKVTRFLSEMGVAKAEAQPSLKVAKSALSEETQVVVLERSK